MNQTLELIHSVPFLAGLTLAEAKRLSEEARVLVAPAGKLLVREGDQAEWMFVIARGSVQIYVRGFDGQDVVLDRVDAPGWFGEQALLPGGTGRRNANVRALEECRLLVLSREVFHRVLTQDSELLKKMKKDGEDHRVLRAHKLGERVFANLGVQTERSDYRFEEFAAGETVLRQGEPADRLYLILGGRAQAQQVVNGQERILSEMRPGQFFGEIALINDEPRTATVVALEPLQTVSLEGGWFREAHRKNPVLRSLMDSLMSLYLLPRRGILVLQTGQIDGKPAVTAVHSLPDGRKILSTRLASTAAFTARVVGSPPATAKVTFQRPGNNVYRELSLVFGVLVEIQSEGEWTALGEMLGALLDGRIIEEWELELFKQRGDFRAEDLKPLYEAGEEICACTKATAGQVQQAILEGCHTLDAVAARTSATRVCGGCAPLVRELLGKSEWTPARVCRTVDEGPGIRTFCLKSPEGTMKSYLPGQHVVIQARIDNRWVQRAYTLSAAPGSGEGYEVTVKREPGGVFSRWLFDRAKADSLLRVSDPSGSYYLPEDQTSDVVCLVGGIGVTPALAMARSLVARPRPFRMHLDYSVSEQSQLICRDEILGLAGANPKISARIRLTRDEGRFGTEDAKELADRFPDATYYLCGSEGYMKGVQERLAAAGVDPSRIRTEVFTVAGAKPVGAGATEAPPVLPPMSALERPLTREEEARQLLHQYYTEMGQQGVFEARWRRVKEELASSGTWVKTPEELSFAARVAWRNSTRCVGRLYWNGLTLRDFRHVSTGEGMLDAIMGHIEVATNGGSLRPVITVFPPKDPAGNAPRVWSPQLFRYAGYRNADGKVVGDPANVKLTEVAMSLGWRPPATRSPFDLLPVVVQAAGEKPCFREIPRHLVLEIPIVHPDFPWFAELGLRWYALPAVSGMLMHAGGLEYTAAPFNGWYMGPEIGARNFGDTCRYDMLPVVARGMGLDTSSDRTLWRDRALIELNVAVLHSYDRAGVTMMDHHAASHAFDKFEAMEIEAGRPVHARWNWIVPPISGSAVTIFHRDSWQDIELKPNYHPQPDPW